MRRVLVMVATAAVGIGCALLALATRGEPVIGMRLTPAPGRTCPTCGVCPGGVECWCTDERCPCWRGR